MIGIFAIAAIVHDEVLWRNPQLVGFLASFAIEQRQIPPVS
jgi:hypothetical protein